MTILADYFSEPEAAAELKVCTRTLKNWRSQRQGPAWTRIAKSVFYRRDAIVKWLKDQEQQPVRSHRRNAAA